MFFSEEIFQSQGLSTCCSHYLEHCSFSGKAYFHLISMKSFWKPGLYVWGKLVATWVLSLSNFSISFTCVQQGLSLHTQYSMKYCGSGGLKLLVIHKLLYYFNLNIQEILLSWKWLSQVNFPGILRVKCYFLSILTCSEKQFNMIDHISRHSY